MSEKRSYRPFIVIGIILVIIIIVVLISSLNTKCPGGVSLCTSSQGCACKYAFTTLNESADCPNCSSLCTQLGKEEKKMIGVELEKMQVSKLDRLENGSYDIAFAPRQCYCYCTRDE